MNYISLFSGALGLDLGLEKAGFIPLLFCEKDKFCSETIRMNRPDVPLLGDILNYTTKDIKKFVNKEIDIVVGGPPCQAFSTAGNRKSFNDPRGNLVIKFLELATDLNPKFIVIENVRGILSTPIYAIPDKYIEMDAFKEIKLTEKGSVIRFIKKFLEMNGYSVSFNLYNASFFGVPQNRERLILIANKSKNKLPYLTPTHSLNNPLLPEPLTLEEAIADIENINHKYIQFPDKRLRFYKMLKEGQNWTNLPTEELKIEALGKAYYLGGGKTGFLRRLAWNKPSPTLVTNPCMPATDLCHPTKDRPLSIEEYARIQQFPDNWVFSGSLTQQYKQIGNAVPVGLGYAIGKRIKDGHQLNTENDKFIYSRYKKTSDIDFT